VIYGGLMPPKVKINRDDIVNVAVDLVRRGGASALNARAVATELGCSTQPVFSNFATMDALLSATLARTYEIYFDFINEYRIIFMDNMKIVPILNVFNAIFGKIIIAMNEQGEIFIYNRNIKLADNKEEFFIKIFKNDFNIKPEIDVRTLKELKKSGWSINRKLIYLICIVILKKIILNFLKLHIYFLKIFIICQDLLGAMMVCSGEY
jgi:AcrR family transcriptional regulator